MSTFKEPFLQKVKDALEEAVSITYEGCHKIYICMDQASHDQQVEWGYTMTMVNDDAEFKDEAMDILSGWWEGSCGLRFISTITDCDDFGDVISQFEYDESQEAETV
jgi:hypothetical protein